MNKRKHTNTWTINVRWPRLLHKDMKTKRSGGTCVFHQFDTGRRTIEKYGKRKEIWTQTSSSVLLSTLPLLKTWGTMGHFLPEDLTICFRESQKVSYTRLSQILPAWNIQYLRMLYLGVVCLEPPQLPWWTIDSQSSIQRCPLLARTPGQNMLSQPSYCLSLISNIYFI